MPKLLVVEDDFDLAGLIKAMMKTVNVDVVIVRDGGQALETLDRDLPDAILTDLNMPRIDGLELCQTLRSSPTYQAIPILVYTGVHKDDARIHELSSMPGVEVAEKPLPARTLIEKVAAMTGVDLPADLSAP